MILRHLDAEIEIVIQYHMIVQCLIASPKLFYYILIF